MARSLSHLRSLSVLCLLCAGLACSDSSTAPDPDPDGGPQTEDPVPGGVLLEGDSAASALAALRDLPPSPVEPADATGGILTTRLEAIVAGGATVDAVNAALEAHGARIVAMSTGVPLVTLVVDPLADAAAAETLATALAAEDAFLDAFPVPDPETLVEPVTGARPTAPEALSTAEYFAHSRMNAAHNAIQLAFETNNRVVVLVPDNYHVREPHPNIVHDFAGNGHVTNFGPGGTSWGNWGFHASGIIAAWPTSDFAPFHPAPELLLDVRSIPLGGMGWSDRVRLIAGELPASGQVVISHGRAYEHSVPEAHPRDNRTFHAMIWRATGAAHAARTFVATAAGDDGEVDGLMGTSRFGTFFGVSAAHPDLMDAVAGMDSDVQNIMQYFIDQTPATSVPATNIVTVGASDASGNELSTSSRESRFRMVAEGVEGPCVFEESGAGALCTDGRAAYGGTQAATPQVAALAAYLWNLDPDRTPEQIRTILDNAYALAHTPGVVDAYAAVLSLDPSVDSGAPMPVRRAVLDVVRGDGSPSTGRFDEADLEAYLDIFGTSAGPITDATKRYDLNGDGLVGGPGRARVDLDANAISLTTVKVTTAAETIELDENAVTDLEVLCYYAHTSLYTGDTDMRDTLLGTCTSPPADITVTTQAQLDALDGIVSARQLIIGPSSGTSDITSLDALEDLERVETLLIQNTPGLTTLSPLGNLTVVTNAIALKQCDLLETLDGLQGLIDIEGFLRIEQCASLSSLTGLENLTAARDVLLFELPGITSLSPLGNLTSTGLLAIRQCSGLTALSGLTSLTEITNGLSLHFLENLTSLTGLPPIADVLGTVQISFCHQLTSLDGLESLQSSGGLVLLNCDLLADISALSSLQTTGLLRITNLPALTSLTGLEGLTTATQIELRGVGITSLVGLSSLTSFSGTFLLGPNPDMVSLEGLESLSNAVLDDVRIEGNVSLVSLEGLGGIREAQRMFIQFNGTQGSAGLQSLDGLALTSVGTIAIQSNPELTSIDALSGTEVTDVLTISACGALSNVDGLDAVTSLSRDLTILQCFALDDLGGLAGLTTVDGNLRIENVGLGACEIADFVAGIAVGGTVTVPSCRVPFAD